MSFGVIPQQIPMKVEILRVPPISGRFTERHYEVSARANEWVRFEDDEGRDWVGVFGSAELANFSAAVPFPDDGVPPAG